MLTDQHELSKLSGNSRTILTGFDYYLTEDVLAGISIGGEKTRFSMGSNGSNRLSGIGVTVSPYVGYILNQYLTAEAAFSYGHSINDSNQDLVGIVSSGTYEANRYMGSLTVSGYYSVKPFDLKGLIGYDIAHLAPNNFTDSLANRIKLATIDLQQVRVGGEVSVDVAEFQPYLSSIVSIDTINSGNDRGNDDGSETVRHGRVGVQVGGGVKANITDSFVVGVQASTMLARPQEKNTTVGLFTRLSF